MLSASFEARKRVILDETGGIKMSETRGKTLRQIPNINAILGMKVVNNPEAFRGENLTVVSAACCSEAAFLATAFGPDFLDKEITLEQFLEAFQVGNITPRPLSRM